MCLHIPMLDLRRSFQDGSRDSKAVQVLTATPHSQNYTPWNQDSWNLQGRTYIENKQESDEPLGAVWTPERRYIKTNMAGTQTEVNPERSQPELLSHVCLLRHPCQQDHTPGRCLSQGMSCHDPYPNWAPETFRFLVLFPAMHVANSTTENRF